MMRTVPLGPGTEFDRIRAFLEGADRAANGVEVGPGDDAAVLAGGWVVTVDLSIEGVHFLVEWLDAGEIGYRAVAAAGSDLAAMAAEPAAALLSLALPDRLGEEFLSGLRSGVREACTALGAPLVGGDLSRSPEHLVLDVIALGRAEGPVLRSGARPGDEIWVTGVLGGSAGAVRAWRSGETPSPTLRDAFARPRPRVREALWLRDRGHLRALIDLSDGLAGDAGHIAAASGAAVVLEPTAIPLHPALEGEVAGEAGGALHLALHGGEDYELCFAAPPRAIDEEEVERFRDRFSLPLTRIGNVEEGSGVHLFRPGGEGREPLTAGGFDHFAGQGRTEG